MSERLDDFASARCFRNGDQLRIVTTKKKSITEASLKAHLNIFCPKSLFYSFYFYHLVFLFSEVWADVEYIHWLSDPSVEKRKKKISIFYINTSISINERTWCIERQIGAWIRYIYVYMRNMSYRPNFRKYELRFLPVRTSVSFFILPFLLVWMCVCRCWQILFSALTLFFYFYFARARRVHSLIYIILFFNLNSVCVEHIPGCVVHKCWYSIDFFFFLFKFSFDFLSVCRKNHTLGFYSRTVLY